MSWEPLAVVLVAIVTRFGLDRRKPDFDTYGHLYFTDEVERQGTGPSDPIHVKVVGSETYSHPFLWHWLLSKLPRGPRIRYQSAINPALDALFACALYGLLIATGISPGQGLGATLAYLFTPMWFSRLSIGPRLNTLTPRLSSEIGVNLFVLLLLLPLEIPLWLRVGLASACGAMVLLSSKFGTQALMFLIPPIALFAADPSLLIALILSILLAIAVSRGRVVRQWEAQATHLKWYYLKNRKGTVSISTRNSIRAWKDAWTQGAQAQSQVLSLIHHALVKNTFTGVLLKMPVLIVAMTALWHEMVIGETFGPSVLWPAVVAGFLIFTFVCIPTFLFLGEAERYLTHVAGAIVATAAAGPAAGLPSWPLVAVILWGGLFWIAERLWLRRTREAVGLSRGGDGGDVIQMLKTRDRGEVVLCYPYSAAGGFYRVMLETPHRVVAPYMVPEEFSRRFEAKYASDYPFVKLETLDEMAEELGVSVIIVDEISLRRRGLENWKPSGLWRRIEHQASRWQLWESS